VKGRNLKGSRSVEGTTTVAGVGVRLWRMSWLFVLIGQGLPAVAWCWLSPRGFGPGHPRFWVNQVAAPTIAIAAIVTLSALRRESPGPLRLLLPAWPSAWAGMAIALRLAFPITMARLWLVPLGIALAMGLAAIRPWRMGAIDGRRLRGLSVTICVSILTGAALVAAVRPPAAGTHPLNAATASTEPSDPSQVRVSAGSIRLGTVGTIQTSDGSVMARVEPLTITVQPLLTFLSQSPDGSPVALVPAAERTGPEPRFREGWRIGDRSTLLTYDIRGQGYTTLRSAIEPGTGAIVVEAASRLDRTIYSHLNAFCDIEVRGHRRLALEFSPCPGALVEVRHFGYPSGRPARFAFVTAERTFRVVEATSGEKGPFRTLAQGRLDPDQALTITLHDENRAVARLTLDDFAAQVDTTRSPAAGWSVPVNAIEFSLSDDSLTSPASIFVTLAGTSVGRGWDCVGHKAGTYRNRTRLEAVGDARQPASVPH
jgi:hypothetical protein